MNDDMPTWADITPADAAEWSMCRRCGAPVIQLPNIAAESESSSWVHAHARAMWLGSRGCRAATFDHHAKEAWNDSIPSSWMAAPKAGVHLSRAEIEAIKRTKPKPRQRESPWDVPQGWADDPLKEEITAAWRADREEIASVLRDRDLADRAGRGVDEAWRSNPRGRLAATRRAIAREAMLQRHPERRQAYRDLLDRLLESRDRAGYDEDERRLDAQWLDDEP